MYIHIRILTSSYVLHTFYNINVNLCTYFITNCNRLKDNENLLTSDQKSEHHEVTRLATILNEHEEEMTTFGYAVVDTKNVRI